MIPDLGKAGVFDGVDLLVVLAICVLFMLACWAMGWWLGMVMRKARRLRWLERGRANGRWTY